MIKGPIRNIFFPIFGPNGRVQRRRPVTQNSSHYNQHPKVNIQPKICNQCYILKCCTEQRVEQTYSYDYAYITSKF